MAKPTQIQWLSVFKYTLHLHVFIDIKSNLLFKATLLLAVHLADNSYIYKWITSIYNLL